MWGVACIVAIRIIHPPIEAFVDKIPYKLGVALLCILYIGFISDLVITVMSIMHIKKRIAILEDISSEMRKISDKTGEMLFDTVEDVRDKKPNWTKKIYSIASVLRNCVRDTKKLSTKEVLYIGV